MRNRPLGRSGIQVGELGLGTWGLSGEGYGPCTEENAKATLRAAVDAGASFVETADCYAEGAMLRWIGELKREAGADRVFASVRVGVDRDPANPAPRKDFSAKYLAGAAEKALRGMGVEALDAVVLHNPTAKALLRGEPWQTLTDLKATGKARLIGVSASTEETVSAALSLQPDLLVIPYNLCHSALLHHFSRDVGETQVGLVVRSPLAYGLLADNWPASRRFTDDDHRLYRWTPKELVRRGRQRDVLRGALVKPPLTTLRQAALGFALSNGLVSVVVPGARTPGQATENATAFDGGPYLPDAVMADLGTILAKADAA